MIKKIFVINNDLILIRQKKIVLKQWLADVLRNNVWKKSAFFNGYFTETIKHLFIGRNKSSPKLVNLSSFLVLSAANEFQNHPSILKIKSNRTYPGIRFRPVNYEEVVAEFRYVKNNSIGGNSYLKIVRKHLSVFVKFVAKDIMHASKRQNFLIN